MNAEVVTTIMLGASVAVNAGVWVRLGALLAGHDDMENRLDRLEHKIEGVKA